MQIADTCQGIIFPQIWDYSFVWDIQMKPMRITSVQAE